MDFNHDKLSTFFSFIEAKGHSADDEGEEDEELELDRDQEGFSSATSSPV